jgi:hypothetical protein
MPDPKQSFVRVQRRAACGRALTHAKRIDGSPSVDLDRRQVTRSGRSMPCQLTAASGARSDDRQSDAGARLETPARAAPVADDVSEKPVPKRQ